MKKRHSRHSKHFSKKQSHKPAMPNTESPNDTKGQKAELMADFLNGKRHTVKSSMKDLGLYALSQRCGDLRRKYGIPIQSQFIKLLNGKRVKEYWLDPDYIKQHSEATA